MRALLRSSVVLLLGLAACEQLIGADFDSAFERPAQGDAGGDGVGGGAGGTDAEPDSSVPPSQGGVVDDGGEAMNGAGGGLTGAAGEPTEVTVGGAGEGMGGWSAGAAGAPGVTYACGKPTPELDPDGDLLNDECDTDDDEDLVPDGAEPQGRRNPLVPRPAQGDSRLSAPGVVLGDACVKAALVGAGEALAKAGLAQEFPLHLEHEPLPLAMYYRRPSGAGYYVGGSAETPGAELGFAEQRFLPLGAAEYAWAVASYDSLGDPNQVKMSSPPLRLRGTSSRFSLLKMSPPSVTIYSGTFSPGGVSDVFELRVEVASSNLSSGNYPQGSCPATLKDSWAVSYAPRWEEVELDDLLSACRDETGTHFATDNWLRGDPPKSCSCVAPEVSWDAGGKLSCTQ